MSTSWLKRVNIWEYEENSYLFLHRDQSQAVTLMQPFNCIHAHVCLMCIEREGRALTTMKHRIKTQKKW